MAKDPHLYVNELEELLIKDIILGGTWRRIPFVFEYIDSGDYKRKAFIESNRTTEQRTLYICLGKYLSSKQRTN